jgi:aryl-alcohol dehydrogenase-like predicted oxidoreductase
MTSTATASGTFAIGGDLEVTRMGFGAMRVTGDGIWGPPRDRDAAIALLRLVPELGVDFIDTADAYGPYVSEDLLREALHPYGRVVVATKAGLVRPGRGSWVSVGRPEYLRHCCEQSLVRLGVERIDLFQLHRIDPTVPRELQFALLRALQDEGKVRHLGLSEVSVEEIEAAGEFFEVSTVQNRYNVAYRDAEDVLAHCEAHGIGLIPWYPLEGGELAQPGGPLARIAQAHDATPGQVALAWLLAHSPVILPIPGTASPAHLQENVAAAQLRLTDAELTELDDAA